MRKVTFCMVYRHPFPPKRSPSATGSAISLSRQGYKTTKKVKNIVVSKIISTFAEDIARRERDTR